MSYGSHIYSERGDCWCEPVLCYVTPKGVPVWIHCDTIEIPDIPVEILIDRVVDALFQDAEIPEDIHLEWKSGWYGY